MHDQVRMLDRSEHGRTRSLYQEIFREDTKAFVDYYYLWKVRDNKIFVIEKEGEILSMLHCNPYRIELAGNSWESAYIVAVATREEYRHRGLMRRLLRASMQKLKECGCPFVFLMPAAEAIYRPFGFRFIYQQQRGRLDFDENVSSLPGGFFCRKAVESDLKELAEFAEDYWKKHANTYAGHTESYFHLLLAEQACQKGEVVLIMERQRIQGYFFTTREGERMVREPVIVPGREAYLPAILRSWFGGEQEIKIEGITATGLPVQERIPLIMARALHLEHFTAGLCAETSVSFFFFLEDGLITENEGAYELRIWEEGASLTKIEQTEAMCRIDVGDFTALVFGNRTAAEAGWSTEMQKDWERVKTYAPVVLNEVV